MIRRVEVPLLGALLAVLVVGAALEIALLPPVTRALATAVGSERYTGLSRERTLELAEGVRAYVAGTSSAQLPAEVDGRAGFDAAQVSHLDDVRAVIVRAHVATAALLLAVGTWLAAAIRRGRRQEVRRVLTFAGTLLLAGAGVVVLLGVFDFERLFTAFHGLFFKAGTWQFAAEDLVIQVFPEAFWASAGALWGGLCVLGGLLLLFLGRRSRELREVAARHNGE